MRNKTRIAIAALLAAALLSGTGCEAFVKRVPRPFSSNSVKTPLEGAKTLEADIRFDVGTLSVEGGANGALDAEFRYTRDDWKPTVDYDVLGDTGRLELRQPEGSGLGIGAHRNEWEIALPEDVPLDLSVTTGVSRSDLSLSDLDLRKLDVNLGTGEADIDLSGIDHDLAAGIECGVGDLTLRVPKAIGVRITGFEDGIGDYETEGFTRDGDALVNEAYERSDVMIEVALRRGVGDVRVLSAD